MKRASICRAGPSRSPPSRYDHPVSCCRRSLLRSVDCATVRTVVRSTRRAFPRRRRRLCSESLRRSRSARSCCLASSESLGILRARRSGPSRTQTNVRLWMVGHETANRCGRSPVGRSGMAALQLRQCARHHPAAAEVLLRRCEQPSSDGRSQCPRVPLDLSAARHRKAPAGYFCWALWSTYRIENRPDKQACDRVAACPPNARTFATSIACFCRAFMWRSVPASARGSFRRRPLWELD